MIKKGYIFVRNDHALFPEATATAIQDRVAQITRRLEDDYKISLPAVRFSLKIQGTGARSANETARQVLSYGSYLDVRLVFSAAPIPKETVTQIFPKTDLLVLIEEGPAAGMSRIHSTKDTSTCRLIVGPGLAARAIEDVMLDVCLGAFFRTTQPLSQVFSNEGFGGLFLRKAKFCKSRSANGWIKSIDRRSRYALLSALNEKADSDIAGRAQAAYESWIAFADDLRLLNRETASNLRQTAPIQAKFRRQLPLKAIRKSFEALPDGGYALVVIRRSLARKTPVVKDLVTSIFGPSRRINSFRFVAIDAHSPLNDSIKELKRIGFVQLIPVNKPLDETDRLNSIWSDIK